MAEQEHENDTLPLHRRYRPKDFDEVFGNESTVNSLKNLTERKMPIPHVFLFFGPTGCGKTTLGRIVAEKMLNCNMEINYFEINAGCDGGIDTARGIIENMNYGALGGGSRVILIDECHRINTHFANAMLKPLEDTPEHIYFILCTTEPEALIETILNRCSRYKVEKLSDEDLYNLVDWVLEDLDRPSLPDNVFDKLAETVDGCAREALVILDQIIGLDDPEDMIKSIVSSHNTAKKQAKDLFDAIQKAKSWKVVSGVLKKLDGDPENIRRAVLGLATYHLLQGDERSAQIIDCFRDNYFNSGKAGLVLSAYDASDKG